MGSDVIGGEIIELELDISIHAPAWGATFKASFIRSLKLISIHAPAWGATFVECEGSRSMKISIHAPAWGATLWTASALERYCYFNPRSRVGSDYACKPHFA